ncbi:hypothetical protein B6D60_04205 [candidate division KSB1 bacterium 4484_87]|nr:MAG: hypothetical protein B6D60_04205 [candidate division KSB1 bacterium 4484_87]
MFRKIFIYFLIATFALLSCHTASNQAVEKKQIEKLITNYNLAFDAKRFDQFVSFCHDDFRFFTLDGQIFDKKGTASFLNRILEEWSEIQSQVQNVEIDCESHLACARYTVVYNYQMDGLPNSMTARITAIFKKAGNKWQMYHYHMSRRYF